MSHPIQTFHQLKCSRRFFEMLWTAAKDFELRKDDRGYKVGDVLFICETNIGEPDGDPGTCIWTGRWVAARITGIIRSKEDAGSFPSTEGIQFHESLAKSYVALLLDDVVPGTHVANPGRWMACGDEAWDRFGKPGTR